MKNLALCGVMVALSTLAHAESRRLKLQFDDNGGAPLRFSNTIWGPTGLIFIPTAYTSAPKEVTLGMAITTDYAAAAVGYSFFPDIEFGVTYLDRTGEDNKVIGNAKIHILPKNFDKFELGIGVMDVAGAIDQSFYVVGSADLITPNYTESRGAVGLRVHGGVGTGYFSEKPFGGAELFLENNITLIGEWDTKNLNFGARYGHNDEFFVEFGTYSVRPMIKMNYVMRF